MFFRLYLIGKQVRPGLWSVVGGALFLYACAGGKTWQVTHQPSPLVLVNQHHASVLKKELPELESMLEEIDQALEKAKDPKMQQQLLARKYELLAAIDEKKTEENKAKAQELIQRYQEKADKKTSGFQTHDQTVQEARQQNNKAAMLARGRHRKKKKRATKTR